MSEQNENNSKGSNPLIVNTLNSLFAEHQKQKQKQTNQGSKATNAAETRTLELALTTVLVDLAVSDQNFEPSEYTLIQKSLQSLFNTPKTEVSALVNQAVSRLKSLRGSGAELAILKESLSEDQKKKVVQAIDDLIEADGIEDGFEIYMRSKFIDLLGMDKQE